MDSPSAAWAYGHIGATSYDSIGMKLVTVIDAAGHQTFTFIEGDAAAFDVMGPGTIRLPPRRVGPLPQPKPSAPAAPQPDATDPAAVADSPPPQQQRRRGTA